MFKPIHLSVTILARLSDSLSISINNLRVSVHRILKGFHDCEQLQQRIGPINLPLAQDWFFSPGCSYITAVLVNTTPMTGHGSCWSRPASWDQFHGLGQDSHQLARWSALLTDPGCHLLVCIAWVAGSNAACVTTLSSWLSVILRAAKLHCFLAWMTETFALCRQPEKCESLLPTGDDFQLMLPLLLVQQVFVQHGFNMKSTLAFDLQFIFHFPQ